MGMSQSACTLKGMPPLVLAMHCAVMENNRAALRELLNAGVDVNYPWDNPSNPSIKDGCTALLCAVSLNHVDLAKMLLDAGADVNKCDQNGASPLYKAAFHARPLLIGLLIQAGADVNLATRKGKSPLQICIDNARASRPAYTKASVQRLLAAGASMDICDERRLTPVHAAAGWRLREVLELLIQAKCDINAIDEAGRTPLYLCTAALSSVLYREDMRVRLPCLQLLMLHGADVLNLVEWLMSKGSDIPSELHAEHREFLEWYRAESRNPGSLKNLCRKSVQLRLRQRSDWVVSVDRLPLPPCLKQYVRRKLFIRPDRGQLASNTAVIGAHNAACL